MPKYKVGWQPISSEILPNAKWNSKTFFFPILNFHYVKLDFSEVTLQPRMSLRTSAHIAQQCNNAHFSQRWDKHFLIFPVVWYPNKHANFNFSLCACSLFSFALITPRHSWMTHSRMNQPSQIQPELFLDCPLRSFGVCLHSTRMLKHQRSCSSWHRESNGEGKVEDRGKTGQRDDAMDHTGADTASLVWLQHVTKVSSQSLHLLDTHACQCWCAKANNFEAVISVSTCLTVHMTWLHQSKG